MSLGKTLVLSWLAVAAARNAHAEWPYLTEEASTLGTGRFSLAVGAGWAYQDSPFLPGGRGTLWTLPELEGTLGIGPRTEVSFQYGLYLFRPSGNGGPHYESGDFRIWTKLGLLGGEGWTSSLRFGVKVPTASETHRLGTDETDFLASLLLDSHLGDLRLSLNAGLGLLGSTEVNQSQDDVFTWGAAVSGPAGESLSLGLEVAGMAGPWGIRTKRDYATLGAVATWTAGPWRFGLSGRRGMVDALSWSAAAGVTYEK